MLSEVIFKCQFLAAYKRILIESCLHRAQKKNKSKDRQTDRQTDIDRD